VLSLSGPATAFVVTRPIWLSLQRNDRKSWSTATRPGIIQQLPGRRVRHRPKTGNVDEPGERLAEADSK